jgi:hypothetical protein
MAQLAIDTADSEWGAGPGTDDGLLVGRNADSKVGFFGTTPVARPALPTDTASIIAALVALGLVKSA